MVYGLSPRPGVVELWVAMGILRAVLCLGAAACACEKAPPPLPAPPAAAPAPALTLTPEPRQSVERGRLRRAKEALKFKRPKTGRDLASVLGEPSETIQTPQFTLFLWNFETAYQRNETVRAGVDEQGTVILLEY